jgi:hypothetical protein
VTLLTCQLLQGALFKAGIFKRYFQYDPFEDYPLIYAPHGAIGALAMTMPLILVVKQYEPYVQRSK